MFRWNFVFCIHCYLPFHFTPLRRDWLDFLHSIKYLCISVRSLYIFSSTDLTLSSLNLSSCDRWDCRTSLQYICMSLILGSPELNPELQVCFINERGGPSPSVYWQVFLMQMRRLLLWGYYTCSCTTCSPQGSLLPISSACLDSSEWQ